MTNEIWLLVLLWPVKTLRSVLTRSLLSSTCINCLEVWPTSTRWAFAIVISSRRTFCSIRRRLCWSSVTSAVPNSCCTASRMCRTSALGITAPPSSSLAPSIIQQRSVSPRCLIESIVLLWNYHYLFLISDVWSAGCVLAELLLGQPIFPGDSGVDQLVEVIKVLGTPTREQIREMNPNYTEFKFPQIKSHPWQKVSG